MIKFLTDVKGNNVFNVVFSDKNQWKRFRR